MGSFACIFQSTDTMRKMNYVRMCNYDLHRRSDGIKRMYTNTEFPDQVVEYSTNSGEKWKTVPKDWLMKSYNSRILVRAV